MVVRKEAYIVYEYFQEKMFGYCDKCPDEISVDRARFVLAKYNIPKKYFYPIIKEMEMIGLLKKIDLTTIKLIRKNSKPLDERLPEVSHDLGLW